MSMVARSQSELAHDALVGLFKSACEVYTTDDFRMLVAAGVIPNGLVDTLAGGVVRHWSVLQGVEEPQVLQALGEAKPDVAELLTSPDGRKWVNHLAGRLAVIVPLRMLSQIFS